MASRKQKAALKAAKLAVGTPTGRTATRLALRTGVPQDIAVRRAQTALPFLPDPEPRRSGRALKVVGVGVGVAGVVAIVSRRRRAQPAWPTTTPPPEPAAPTTAATPSSTPTAGSPVPSSAPRPSSNGEQPTSSAPSSGQPAPAGSPTPGASEATVESGSTQQGAPTPVPAAPDPDEPGGAGGTSSGDRGVGDVGAAPTAGDEPLAPTVEDGGQPGGYDDGMLAVAVRHALLEGKPPRAVTIEVSGGVVTLSGNADTQDGADQMVREAEAVEGVKAVLPQFDIGGGGRSTGTEDH